MAVVLCQGDRGPGSWKGLEIGYPFVLRYEGHRLWEERVPLWPVNRYRGLWVTLTPDYYKYVEDCSCPGGEGGPVDLQLFRAPLAPGGFRQPDGLGKVYCFANRPDVIELRDLIRDAFGLAVQEADYVQEIPGHVYDPSGQEVTLDYVLLWRQLPRRLSPRSWGAGGAAACPGGRAQVVCRGPAP